MVESKQPTVFDADDWERRVVASRDIADPVERRKTWKGLLEEVHSAEGWVQEMGRDIDFLRGMLEKSLDRLERTADQPWTCPNCGENTSTARGQLCDVCARR